MSTGIVWKETTTETTKNLNELEREMTKYEKEDVLNKFKGLESLKRVKHFDTHKQYGKRRLTKYGKGKLIVYSEQEVDMEQLEDYLEEGVFYLLGDVKFSCRTLLKGNFILEDVELYGVRIKSDGVVSIKNTKIDYFKRDKSRVSVTMADIPIHYINTLEIKNKKIERVINENVSRKVTPIKFEGYTKNINDSISINSLREGEHYRKLSACQKDYDLTGKETIEDKIKKQRKVNKETDNNYLISGLGNYYDRITKNSFN